MAKFFNVDKLIDTIGEYVKVKVDLVKVDLIERLSGLGALLISFLTIFMISLFLLAFISLAFASYLNVVLNSLYAGYLIVSGFYLLLVIIIFFVLKSGRLKAMIESAVLKSMEKKEDQNGE